MIQICRGYAIGKDLLLLRRTQPNISASRNTTQGELALSKTASFTDYKTAIETATYQTPQTVFTEDKFFFINL